MLNIKLCPPMLFILFICIALPCSAKPIKEMQSNFGIVTVDGPFPANSPLGKFQLLVDNKIISIDSNYFSLIEKYSLNDEDVIIFGMDPLGTCCSEYDDIRLLLLSKNSPPKIITDKKLYSNTHIAKGRIKNNSIIIDLGYEDGKSKSAIYNNGTILVKLSDVHDISLNDDDCQWLYASYTKACVEFQGQSCERVSYDQAESYRRSLILISNKPGFNNVAYDTACANACKSRTSTPINTFRKDICGIK